MGRSIKGTHTKATINRINWIWSCDVFPGVPQSGNPPQQSSVLPSFKGTLIIVVIIEGAKGIVAAVH